MTIARTAFCMTALFGAVVTSACGSAALQQAAPQPAVPATSWVSPEAKGADLLYLSDVKTNAIDIFTYPQGKPMGTLTKFGAPRGECVDRKGNVWIVDVQGYDVVEYAHGGMKPLVALSTLFAPRGCSADPRSETVAVAGGDHGTILTIFHRDPHGGWRDARDYAGSSIRSGYFCGYDARGNLFVDGVTNAKRGFGLAELKRHGTSLTDVSVSQTIAAPGQVQWDGQYLAVGDTGVMPSVIHQFSVSDSTATEAGSTILNGTTSVRQFWVDGTRVVGPDYDSSAGIFKYPAGGSAITQITSVYSYGAAISAAASSARK